MGEGVASVTTGCGEPGRAGAGRGEPPEGVSPRIVLHVDMDAFYAGVEVRDDPSLKDVPLVVGADPRGGKGRGVVCTASYEARKFGIRSAMPIATAYRLAPHATFIRPDFRRYSEASRRVMEVLERYASTVGPAGEAGELEVVGMDEAYLDVTGPCGGDWDLARSLARSLQAAVRRETGLSCSVGVAPNKSCAKIASDRNKPHGVTLAHPDRLAAFLEPLPVGKVNGCGPKTAAALGELGIRTIGELARTSVARLEQAFGSHGAWLWRIANGDDPRRVDGARGERKSRGNETTFLEDEAEEEEVRKVAAGLLDEILADHAERDQRPYATLTVKVRYRGFVTVSRAHTVKVPMDARVPESDAAAQALVRSLLDPLLDGRPVRLVGVRLSGFTEATGQQRLGRFGVHAGLAPSMAALHGARVRVAGAFDPGGLRWTRLPAFAGAPA